MEFHFNALFIRLFNGSRRDLRGGVIAASAKNIKGHRKYKEKI
jgi:hypothetical protein